MSKIDDKLYQEIMSHSCMTCKFFSQEKSRSVCSHIDATEEEKNYRYYNMHCDKKYKFEYGTHPSRINNE